MERPPEKVDEGIQIRGLGRGRKGEGIGVSTEGH